MTNRNKRHMSEPQSSIGVDRKALRAQYRQKHSKQRATELFSRYETLVSRDGPNCDLCGTGEPVEFDHIVPKPKGGTNDIRNFCLAHEYCNKMKGEDEHADARKRLTQERIEAEAAGQPWPPPAWQYRGYRQQAH